MATKISLHTCRPKRRRIHRPKVEYQLPKIDTKAARIKAEIYGMYVGILDKSVTTACPIDRRDQLGKFRGTLKEIIAEYTTPVPPGQDDTATLLLEIVEKILTLRDDVDQLLELVKLTNSLRGMYDHFRDLLKESLPAARGKGLSPIPASRAAGVQQTRPGPPARA